MRLPYSRAGGQLGRSTDAKNAQKSKVEWVYGAMACYKRRETRDEIVREEGTTNLLKGKIGQNFLNRNLR